MTQTKTNVAGKEIARQSGLPFSGCCLWLEYRRSRSSHDSDRCLQILQEPEEGEGSVQPAGSLTKTKKSFAPKTKLFF